MGNRPSISDIASIGDFQTVFRWKFSILTAPSGISDITTDLGNDLNLRCETTTIPKATNNTFEVNIRGHKIINNGIMTYDNTLTLTFVDTVDNKVRKFFKAWREALWKVKEGTTAGSTNDLKASLGLGLLDNSDNVKWTYKIYGALLQDYDMGALDGMSSDALKPTATFTYDYFEDIESST